MNLSYCGIVPYFQSDFLIQICPCLQTESLLISGSIPHIHNFADLLVEAAIAFSHVDIAEDSKFQIHFVFLILILNC